MFVLVHHADELVEGDGAVAVGVGFYEELVEDLFAAEGAEGLAELVEGDLAVFVLQLRHGRYGIEEVEGFLQLGPVDHVVQLDVRHQKL